MPSAQGMCSFQHGREMVRPVPEKAGWISVVALQLGSLQSVNELAPTPQGPSSHLVGKGTVTSVSLDMKHPSTVVVTVVGVAI